MNAVATLLYNPDYLPGAVVLGHTLRKIVDPNTKLVVLIETARFNHLQLQILRDLWDELVDVDMIESPWETKLTKDLKRPELAKTFSKIHLWALPYDKVLYLDADTLPLVGGSGSVADLLKLDFPKGKIVAAPDSGFPDIFNSGVFALRPSPADFLQLAALATGSDDVSFDGADQGLLNQYFNRDPDWVRALTDAGVSDVESAPLFRDSNWIQVPFLYNTTPTAQYQYLPAFSHFGPENPNAPRSLGPYIDSVPAQATTEDTQHVPAWETLQSYSDTASQYFASGKSRAQVKLLHFIGPLKPWKGMDSGIFSRWWDAWYEYSQGRLIADVLYKQYYTISVRKLRVPGEAETSPESSGVGSGVGSVAPISTAGSAHVSVTPETHVKEYTPADLCDPSNYQQYQVRSEPEHVWDATVETPPVEQPKNSGFSDDLKAYSSEWNEYENQIEEEVQQDVQEEKFVEKEHQEDVTELAELEQPYTLVESDFYGYHRDQKPERVFSPGSDYMPQHYLLVKAERDSASEPEDDDAADEFGNLDISDPDGNFTFDDDTEADDEYEGQEEEEQQPAVDNEDGARLTVETNLPKLFPWEFRDEGYQAERQFD